MVRRAGSCLLSALTDLVKSILYGANECAIKKKDGNIWPIAVGRTIRRLSVKISTKPLVQALREELRPVQLWNATSGGREAAAQVARRYDRDCRYRKVLQKIDISHAFNSLRRDSFLSAVHVKTPGLYSLLW